MKKTIRFGIFETNSSATHTLIIGTFQEFEDWKNGKLLYYDGYGGPKKFIKVEDKDYFKKTIKNCGDYNFLTYEDVFEDNLWEYAHGTYTSPSGDEIKYVAKYGFDF